MFGWLFGKKKKKRKPIKQRLRSHVDLAAEFFAMWPTDQKQVLRALGVPKPDITLDYARPSTNVQALAASKQEDSAPLMPGDFLRELREQLEAGNRIRVIAVFQQIFRDLKEAEEYVTDLEEELDI